MTTHELTRDQMVSLKQAYLCKLDEEGTLNEVLYNDPDDDRGLSMAELADADSLVPDEIIHDNYAGVEFTEDDFL